MLQRMKVGEISLPLCTIEIHASGFRQGAKAAAKRHRSFAAELTCVLKEIEADPYLPGDAIKSSNPNHIVRKVRIGCVRERLTPRHGYRLIYQILDTPSGRVARCLDLYYKPQQADVLPDAVERLVKLALVASADELGSSAETDTENE